MKKHLKYLVFPFVVLITVLVLSFFKITGSSVGVYNNILSQSIKEDKNLIFGLPRYIRGDQFLVAIPMVISQDINEEWKINYDMGEGTKLGLQTFPTRNFSAIFKPSLATYYFTNNTDFSHSFQWWAEFGLLIIGVYFLLLELTDKNLLISILGSLITLLNPFVQWWNQTVMIAWISFGLFFAIRILKERKFGLSVLYGLGLFYSIVAFIMLLYPPFQISVAFVAVFLVVGYILNNLHGIKGNLKISIPIISVAVILASIIIFLYTKEFKDVIEITTKTVYPGSRFIQAGSGSFTHLFDGFYNILLQRDSNIAPFANQSESSNFFMLFPPVILWVIYKNIVLFKKKKKVDWVAISLVSIISLFCSFYFFRIPDFFSKYLLFYLIPPARLIIGIGYGSYLLMLYTISQKKYKTDKTKPIELIVVIILSLLMSFIVYKVGINLYTISPKFFDFPQFLTYKYKIILTTVFSGIITFWLLKGNQKYFLFSLLAFSLVSTLYINPIYKGLDVLTKTDVAQYIRRQSQEDDSKWVAYHNNYLAQYALSNNASIINGIHMYPQFKIWEVLDPEKKYVDIYNRYAHINISEYEEGEEYIKLLYPDALQVNISPCDSRWNNLGVRYIITDREMGRYECLRPLKVFEKNNIFIYELKKNKE